MEELLSKIKHIFNSEKKTENLLLLIILVFVLVFFANTILNSDDVAVLADSKNVEIINVESTEKRLEEILSKINGISEVSVMINYSTTDKVIPVYDVKENIDEQISNGKSSTTSVTEKNVAYQEGENR